jgi:hypothetical protein
MYLSDMAFPVKQYSKKKDFFDLPSEMRNMVDKLRLGGRLLEFEITNGHIGDDIATLHYLRQGSSSHRPNTTLLRACKTTSTEASSLLYAGKRFSFTLVLCRVKYWRGRRRFVWTHKYLRSLSLARHLQLGLRMCCFVSLIISTFTAALEVLTQVLGRGRNLDCLKLGQHTLACPVSSKFTIKLIKLGCN